MNGYDMDMSDPNTPSVKPFHTVISDNGNENQDILEKNNRLEQTARLLLRRDLDLRSINDELESEKQAILEEKNKLEVVLSAVSDAVIGLDNQDTVIVFNNTAESITGFSKDEVTGKTIDSFLSFSVNGEQKRFSEIIRKLNNTEQSKSIDYGEITGKDGKKSSISLKIGQVQSLLTKKVTTILTVHDLSEEHELELMKLDFVSMAAHELRTPLTSITGYLSVYMEEYGKNLETEPKLLLDRVRIAAEQLVVLVESLLSASKVEKGTFTVTLEPIDWIHEVSAAVDAQRERANDKKIMMTIRMPDYPLPPVIADKIRINEVLTNLISNAISYTHEGGKVTVRFEKGQDTVTTHISDTGEGIPEQAIPHLFTKFFRVAGNLAQGSKGTGLGLYISKAIVELHKGKIWVESSENVGSTFSFSLPTKGS